MKDHNKCYNLPLPPHCLEQQEQNGVGLSVFVWGSVTMYVVTLHFFISVGYKPQLSSVMEPFIFVLL